MPSSSLRLALVLTTLAPLGFACRGGLEGSGTAKTESRPVSGFTKIVLASAGDVTIVQSGTESLRVQADDNILPHLTSSVSGGTLTLGVDRGNLHAKTPIRFTVGVKDLSAIDLDGAGDITATGVHTTALEVTVAGAGNVKVAGTADRETVVITGAGDFDGAALESKTIKATVSGAGDAVVNATDTLDVTIDGAGNVTYVGAPRITKSISGTGSIAKR